MVTALKEGARGASGAWRHYARRGLVIAQVAFAVMLVIGTGLLVQTVYNLTRIDAGFDRSRLVTFSMTLPMANSEPEARAQAYQRVLDRLRSSPGVLGTAAMSGLPPNRTPDAIATPIENYTSDNGRPFAIIDYYQFVMGDYFGTMGIPIVAGRGFERTDTASQGKVVIVNETLAKRIWKGRNPIGHRLRPPGGSFGASDDVWHTVIGVAKDVRQRGVERPAGTELYVPLDQHGVAPPSGSGSGRRGSRRAASRHGFGVRRIDSPAETSGAAIGRFCRTGASIGSHRHLRCALLHGYRAAARDRHSGRPRCNSLPRAHTDHEARTSGHGVGSHHWPCRCTCRNSADCVAAVWCATDRYCDDRLCDRDDYGRGGGRQLAAGVARIAARPERRAQR